MDILMRCASWAWNMFTTISIPIVYQGTTYNITFLGMFIFTSFVLIAAMVLFSFFE